jgi:hypothetical protein
MRVVINTNVLAHSLAEWMTRAGALRAAAGGRNGTTPVAAKQSGETGRCWPTGCLATRRPWRAIGGASVTLAAAAAAPRPCSTMPPSTRPPPWPSCPSREQSPPGSARPVRSRAGSPESATGLVTGTAAWRVAARPDAVAGSRAPGGLSRAAAPPPATKLRPPRGATPVAAASVFPLKNGKKALPRSR